MQIKNERLVQSICRRGFLCSMIDPECVNSFPTVVEDLLVDRTRCRSGKKILHGQRLSQFAEQLLDIGRSIDRVDLVRSILQHEMKSSTLTTCRLFVRRPEETDRRRQDSVEETRRPILDVDRKIDRRQNPTNRTNQQDERTKTTIQSHFLGRRDDLLLRRLFVQGQMLFVCFLSPMFPLDLFLDSDLRLFDH